LAAKGNAHLCGHKVGLFSSKRAEEESFLSGVVEAGVDVEHERGGEVERERKATVETRGGGSDIGGRRGAKTEGSNRTLHASHPQSVASPQSRPRAADSGRENFLRALAALFRTLGRVGDGTVEEKGGGVYGVYRLGWRCREMAATDRKDIVVAAENKSVGMAVACPCPAHFRSGKLDRTIMRQRPVKSWLTWRGRERGREAEGRLGWAARSGPLRLLLLPQGWYSR